VGADGAAVTSEAEQRVDLVLEGGAVKGIGLLGALTVLEEHGYSAHRVAGSSAGSILGALIAAGIPASKLVDLIFELDWTKVTDHDAYNRIPILGPLIALALRDGIHPGVWGEQWVACQLATVGIKTFSDLRIAGDDAPMTDRYRLVVVASDLSTRRLVRLPWDYPKYGLDPDAQSVAAAVHASSAIPFIFRPVVLRGADGGVSSLVDGGLLSNFPVGTFDGPGSPRRPIVGIALTPPPDPRAVPHSVGRLLDLCKAIFVTGLFGHDRGHLSDPRVLARTIVVDTHKVSPIDFRVPYERQYELFQNGRAAAEKFLSSWDFESYQREFGSGGEQEEG
jgi:NTE family protein